MKTIKHQLYKACQDYVEQRINTIEKAINSARETATSDSKSSAGDKYETTREMMQQEIDRNTVQLNEAVKLKQLLALISPDKSSTTVQSGSLVLTNNGNFFIAISVGGLEVNGVKYFAISPSSPIGVRLMNLKPGEPFHFNGKTYLINSIE
ncbi:3-oxoacyl-ACP synthase [Solitalea lacus]|uniref:3-oxoacyl-ACP synthase n=1 Tax=Solitalea lacus TaxID=2911172 RepID=UPI001EDC02C3|nr:3-oxoacyl-ACP synthase [Solitalea lacus]UKJ09044.1 3-oxoacyl-ACP synthase [Solitalea lacus]